MDEKSILAKKWGKEPIMDIAKSLNLSLTETMELALELGLQNKETLNIGRTWTTAEEEFLKKHSNELTVRQASNLLYRSHYATYQRVKLLQLNEMIITKK
ncbi:hypothetical protein [Bacillus sp. JCM 19034]|uniref:hypothetical protein n=1 Tax=Bacillus sp. JCM 19034 TaxID=1481928 RepID=UPI00078596D1|nr:hypothetical protein [Bacillus sp. JCM 19034]